MIAIDWKPNNKQLRTFGFVGTAVFALLGGWTFWQGALFGLAMGPDTARLVAGILAGLGGVCLVPAVLWPRGLWPLYLVLNVVALPIGWVISHAVLFVVYFGVVTPIALAMKILGRDALHRRFDPQAESYWTPAETNPPAKRYFRQF